MRFLFVFFLGLVVSTSAFSFDWGINIHLDSSEKLRLMKEMGVDWVRIDLNWNIVEEQQGVFDWSQPDACINQALANGLRVNAIIAYSPTWASSSGKPGGVPRKEDWENYVRKTVARYRHKVEVFTIWNEPNLNGFWEGSASQYVNIVYKPAYNIIRELAPEKPILGPDLAHLYKPTIPVLDFLKTLKSSGVSNMWDIFGHHVYGGNGGSGDFRSLFEGFKFFGITYKSGIKQWMNKAGIPMNKPMWITEFGLDMRKMSAETQAQELVRQMGVLKGLGYVHGAFIFEMYDTPDFYKYGVLDVNGEPKPAYFAVRKYLRGF